MVHAIVSVVSAYHMHDHDAHPMQKFWLTSLGVEAVSLAACHVVTNGKSSCTTYWIIAVFSSVMRQFGDPCRSDGIPAALHKEASQRVLNYCTCLTNRPPR